MRREVSINRAINRISLSFFPKFPSSCSGFHALLSMTRSPFVEGISTTEKLEGSVYVEWSIGLKSTSIEDSNGKTGDIVVRCFVIISVGETYSSQYELLSGE